MPGIPLTAGRDIGLFESLFLLRFVAELLPISRMTVLSRRHGYGLATATFDCHLVNTDRSLSLNVSTTTKKSSAKHTFCNGETMDGTDDRTHIERNDSSRTSEYDVARCAGAGERCGRC